MHNDPTIFPDPHQFLPERWLDNKELDKYLVAFSRGPRMCLGIKYVLSFIISTSVFESIFRLVSLGLSCMLIFAICHIIHMFGDIVSRYLILGNMFRHFSMQNHNTSYVVRPMMSVLLYSHHK